MNKTEHYSNYKWIKVSRLKIDPQLSIEEKFELLEKHHVEETTFLIEEIRRLAKEFDEIASKLPTN